MDGNFDFKIRDADKNDAEILCELIKKLALYEKKDSNEIIVTPDALKKDLNHFFRAKIVEKNGKQPIGYALYFYTYSAFIGKPVLYIEDIFVLPQHQRRGIGTYLLKLLAKEAISKGCCRMEWNAFDWNLSAMDFYESVGAYKKSDLIQMRIEAEYLRKLAE